MRNNHVLEMVRALKPGESIIIDKCELPVSPPGFSRTDWVLEQVIGSAYEYSYRIALTVAFRIVFSRRLEPLDCDSGLHTYVSPDRKRYYDLRPDGLYERNKVTYP